MPPIPTDLPVAADADADWRTTDEQEIARRRERARLERPRVENRDPTGRFPVFSDFEVHSPSGVHYLVEIRDVSRRLFSCPCVDFRVNGLGTCKHVEAVLDHLERELGLEFNAAVRAGSDRVDLVVDHDRQTLRVERHADRLPPALRRLFSADACLEAGFEPDVALELWTAAARAGNRPELRASREVGAWLECRRREAEALALRRTYEQNVQSGRWPAHETTRPLFPYQREGMLHLACGERAMLADEIGLGKTAQALAAAALLHRLGRAGRALVVTPASLREEWREQIERFTTLSHRALDGSRASRLETLDAPEPPFFTLATYEGIAADALEINARLRPDLIILDEAQRIKSWNSKLALAVKRLESRYAFVLTGGPPDARLDELYSLVSFLDPTVLGPLFRFNREYYTFDARGRPAGFRNLDKLRARVRPLVLRRRIADVATQLPGRTERLYLVPVPELARERVQTLTAALRRRLATLAGKPLADDAHERLGRDLSALRLAASGVDIPEDDADPGRALAACPKLRELARLLRECMANPEVKVLVYSEWERTLDAARTLCQRLRLACSFHTGALPAGERREEVRRFRTDPACRVFLSTDAGGPGLHLPEASVVIHLDPAWGAARMDARVARAWQPGQPRPVTVLHLVSEGTLEQRLHASRLGRAEPDAGGFLDASPADAAAADPGERLLRKLARLLGRPKAGEPLAAVPAESDLPPSAFHLPPSPPDPPREFVRRAAALLDGTLVSGEERFPATEGAPSVLFLVVENGHAESARARLAPLETQLLGPAAGAERPVRLETLDRAAAALLARLTAAGVVRDATRATRPLYPLEVDGPADAPALSPADHARAAAEREGAARRLRTARVLLAEDMTGEARAALVAATLAFGRALAIEGHLPVPETAVDAVAAPLAGRWPPRVLAGVREFVSDADAAPEPALEALSRAPLAPEPPRAAREFFAGIKARLAAL